MKRVKKQGYTILEVMIFIAISASMFFIAMIAISGRQQDTQFTQAVRDFDSRLQDLMNDVSTGFFNNPGDFSCTITAGKPNIVSGSEEQGTSDDCIFVGKTLQFGSAESGSSFVDIYNLIGKRNNAGSNVSSISEANPTTADPATVPPERIDLQWGLEVFRVVNKPVTGSNSNHGAISFITSFARTIGNEQISNGQSVRSVSMPNTTIGASRAAMFSVIDNPVTYTTIDGSPEADIVLCLQNQGQERIASITINDEGTVKTDVQLDLYDEACD